MTQPEKRSRARNYDQPARRPLAPVERLESRVLISTGATIFVTNDDGSTIGEYDSNGAAINASLLSGLAGQTYVYPAVSGSDLFVANYYAGTIGEYATSGATINASLLTGLNSGGIGPFGIAVSGSQLYVANGDGGSLGTAGTVSVYTLGSTPGTIAASNPTLITGLADPGGVAVSGSDLFVVDYARGVVGEYTTAGAVVNASLISGLNQPESVAVSGSDVFVSSYTGSVIGEYTTSGATVNANFETAGSGVDGPVGIAIAGSDLFVDNTSDGVVSEYTTSGTTVNPSLISGLTGTISLAVSGTPTSTPALAFAQQPTGNSSDSTLAPITVDIEDSSGHLLTSDNSNVTLAVATGPVGGTLSGTVTTAAVNGVATFSNISITAPGTYTLTATDGTDSPATSSSFVISPVDTSGVYDAANDFSTTVNPNGVWSYGELATESSPFAIYPTVGALDIGQPAVGWFDNGNGPPYVGINTGSTTLTSGSVVLPTGVVDMHPGPNGEYSDVRFTAPSAGPLTLAVTFTGIDVDGTTTDVHVLHDGVSLADGVISAYGGTFTRTLAVDAVAAGDTFDFIVGYGANQNYFSDSTTLSAHITTGLATPVETIGGLDPDFGTSGLASHDVGFASTNGVAEDAGQSVLIGTIGTAPAESFGITRYNSDGSLDTAFGSGGVVNTSFGGTDDVPSAVDVLGNGDILVAGTATTYTAGVAGGSEFAVAEYNPDGSLNSSFGGGTGEALVSFSATAGTLTDDVLEAMAVGAGGTIYLGGSSGNDFAIAALNAAGTTAAFGSGGKVTQSFGGGDDVINSLALQSNGDIVAAGSASIGGVTQIALARFRPGGLLDPRFGVKGLVTTDVRGVYDSASSVVIQKTGQIVIGGISATGSGASLSSDFVIARYTAAGRIDKTFGGGPVITSFGQPSAVTQLVLQTNGQIIASGKTTASLSSVTPDELEVAAARYTIRGALDTTFNGTGKTIVNLASGVAATASVKVDALAAAAIEPLVTSGLGLAFDAFLGSSQGTVAATAGGAILDAGNNGVDTVEAELITAGVDLATSLLSSVPASVTGGARGIATVKLDESGTSLAAGTVTIDLEIATDAQGDGSTPIKSLPERIDLREQQSRTYRIAFVYPQSITAGNYYLIADVVNGSSPALKDLDAENNLSASNTAVNIAPPFVSLVGSALSAASSFTDKKPAVVIFTITNDGNVLAKGATTVDLVLSVDQTASDGTTIDAARIAVGLPAGKSRVYRLSFKLPKTVPKTVVAGAYYLIAVIDHVDSLGTIDQSNSTVVDPAQVIVS